VDSVLLVASKPSYNLIAPTINATDGGMISVGGTFALDCIAEQELGTLYSITWTQPEQVLQVIIQ
jgi:hypothetical protein